MKLTLKSALTALCAAAMLVSFLSVSAVTMHAQSVNQQAPGAKVTVTGIITDDSGLPVIGAAVFPKGNSGAGVVSGLDGDYKITVPGDATGNDAIFSW